MFFIKQALYIAAGMCAVTGGVLLGFHTEVGLGPVALTTFGGIVVLESYERIKSRIKYNRECKKQAQYAKAHAEKLQLEYEAQVKCGELLKAAEDKLRTANNTGRKYVVLPYGLDQELIAKHIASELNKLSGVQATMWCDEHALRYVITVIWS